MEFLLLFVGLHLVLVPVEGILKMDKMELILKVATKGLSQF